MRGEEGEDQPDEQDAHGHDLLAQRDLAAGAPFGGPQVAAEFGELVALGGPGLPGLPARVRVTVRFHV